MKKIFLIIVLFLLTSCGSEFNKYEETFINTFDCPVTVISYCKDSKEFGEIYKLTKENFEYFNKLFDIYNDYEGINNIKTINDNAGIKAVEVSDEIIDLLIFSKDWYNKSNGKLNIAYGSVLKIWHDFRENQKNIPTKETLEEAEKYTDIEDVIIDTENKTVFIKEPKLSLDVGAVAKGYAAQLSADALKEKGFSSFLISAGGNIVAGSKPLSDNKESWVVGIQTPVDFIHEEEAKGVLKTVNINDMSAVTSGDYERYVTLDGKKYHHIINPDTNMPSDYYRSVTIITKDSAVADALSTIIFLLPYDEAIEFLDKFENTEAIFLFNDNSVKMTDGFNEYINQK